MRCNDHARASRSAPFLAIDCPPRRFTGSGQRARVPTRLALAVACDADVARVSMRGGRWQGEVKRAASPFLALGPDSPAMSVDDGAADAQSETMTFTPRPGALMGGGTVVGVKESGQLAWTNPAPGVSNDDECIKGNVHTLRRQRPPPQP